MNDLYLPRTMESPEVDFRFTENQLSLSGEAYPENAKEYFQPILIALERYLASVKEVEIEFNFRLTYFNSAATKMLFNLFGMLNESAATHNRVVLNWYHDEEDDTVLEFGEGIQDDFRAIEFNPVAISAA